MHSVLRRTKTSYRLHFRQVCVAVTQRLRLRLLQGNEMSQAQTASFFKIAVDGGRHEIIRCAACHQKPVQTTKTQHERTLEREETTWKPSHKKNRSGRGWTENASHTVSEQRFALS
jgi:hypothetical protein